MVAEPTYPDDAPVGKPAEEPQPEARESDEADSEKSPESNRTRHIVTGAAIGIGSAALVAALLYANRSRAERNDGKK
jgi:hypothetical protein